MDGAFYYFFSLLGKRGYVIDKDKRNNWRGFHPCEIGFWKGCGDVRRIMNEEFFEGFEYGVI